MLNEYHSLDLTEFWAPPPISTLLCPCRCKCLSNSVVVSDLSGCGIGSLLPVRQSVLSHATATQSWQRMRTLWAQMIVGASSKEELQDLCRLLDFLAVELAANRNFEFVQALLRLTLQV